MKSSIFALMLAALGLGAGFTLTAAPASAAPSCAFAQDVGCDMWGGEFLRPAAAPPASHRLMHTRRMHATDDVRALAAPGMGSAASGRCDDIISGGSGVPAYLYGKCE